MNCSKKKDYQKPVLTTVAIDREITLVMATGEFDPGNGDPRGAPANPAATNSDLKTNNFERSPFNDGAKK